MRTLASLIHNGSSFTNDVRRFWTLTLLLHNNLYNGKLHVPTPPVSHSLVLSDGLFAGEQVRMLSIDDIQIISAAHFDLIRFLLE